MQAKACPAFEIEVGMVSRNSASSRRVLTTGFFFCCGCCSSEGPTGVGGRREGVKKIV